MSSEDNSVDSTSAVTPGNGTTSSKQVDGSNSNTCDDGHFTFSKNYTLEEIRKLQGEFISERNWDQFHLPRSVLLALVAEVGELSEIFQWKGEVKEGLPGWSEEERHHLGQELSDVLLYLIDLAYRCRIDLPKAAVDKLEHNAKKYPKDKVYGSSKKYNQY